MQFRLQSADGLGWIESHKMDPWTTLGCPPPPVNHHRKHEVVKSSTSFGWGKGENVTSAGWQVTQCDPIMACEFP